MKIARKKARKKSRRREGRILGGMHGNLLEKGQGSRKKGCKDKGKKKGWNQARKIERKVCKDEDKKVGKEEVKLEIKNKARRR